MAVGEHPRPGTPQLAGAPNGCLFASAEASRPLIFDLATTRPACRAQNGRKREDQLVATTAANTATARRTGDSITATTTGGAGSIAYGGGVYDHQVALTMTDATVVGNSVGGGGTAAIAGGGLYADGVTSHLGMTILADNSAPKAADGRDCFGTVASAGYDLLGSKTGCTYTRKATDKIGVSPKLDALHANGGPTATMALKKTSPAVNAIPKSACTVKTDQRGVHRPQGPKCDIGAYELKPSKKQHKKAPRR